LPGGLEPGALREAVGLARRLEDGALAESMLLAAKNSDALPASDAAWLRNELAALRALSGDLAGALALREEAARFMGPEEARAVLLSVAREASETLSDHARAATLYEELRRREPAERELWEPLLQAYRRLGDMTRLVDLIEQTIPLVESAEDRARLRLDLATVLLEEPDKLEAAKAILREILDDDPTQRGAAMLLSGILENAGQKAELIELLSSQLNAAKDREDVESIVSMSLRLGALFEQQDQQRDALDAYRAVLDWDPRAKPALEAVLRLAEASSDGFLVADAIEGLLSVAEHDNAEQLAWRLVELRREQADEAGVERALELGFNANPGSAQLGEALLERYQNRSDWHAAAGALRRAVIASSGERELVHRMVEAHRAAEESEAALEIVDALIARRPDDAWLYRERSSVYSDLARADESLADLERAYALSREQPAELVEALEQAIARADPPQDLELTLRLIKVLEETGDLEGARARLAEVVKQSPKDTAVLWRLAALESRAEHWPQAANAFRQLVQLEQGELLVRAALELADVCERAGRLGEARYGLERALNFDRTSAELRQRLRAVYAAGGATRDLVRMMLEDAAAETEVARRLPHLLAAGETLLAPDGDVLEAIRVLEQARALSPDSIEGVVLLARANASADRTDQALSMLRELVASHRGRRSKQLALAYQELSSILLLTGMLSEALGALTKAFEMDARNGRLAMQLGQLALDIDDDETAARAFRSVTMMRPTDGDANEGATPDAKAEAHYQLARLAQKQGDLRKAKLLVTKALAENPQLEAARLLLLDLEAAERRA
jgi:lipopolysaccharide biosynthesis regulator YciM